MIAGQFPRRAWRPNPDGASRTIEEGLAIARGYGIVVPDDVEFHFDDSKDLDENHTARSSRVEKPSGSRVVLSDLRHDQTGKIPFRIWSGLAASDEAIVAVIAHELHELSSFRPFLEAGTLSVDDYILQAEPNRPGNFHDEAWDVADRVVDAMRGASRP